MGDEEDRRTQRMHQAAVFEEEFVRLQREVTWAAVRQEEAVAEAVRVKSHELLLAEKLALELAQESQQAEEQMKMELAQSVQAQERRERALHELHEQTSSEKKELEHLVKQLESDKWEHHEAVPLPPVDIAKARARVPAAWLHGIEVQKQVIMRRPMKRKCHYGAQVSGPAWASEEVF